MPPPAAPDPVSPSARDRIFVFGLGLAAAAAAILARGARPLGFGDAAAYQASAEALLRTGRYPSWTDLFVFRPPGYPVFLLLATAGHPSAALAARLANAVLHGAAAVLLSAVAARLFSSRRAGLAAGALAATWPPLLLFASEVGSESLFLFFGASCALLLLAATDRPSSGLALAAGGALALASLARPAALALSPLLAAPALDRRLPRRVGRALAVSALAGFAGLLAPWTLRNAIAYRAFLPVSDGAGLVFYQGNSSWNVRYFAARTPEELASWQRDFGTALRRDWPQQIPGAWSANPAERSRAFARAAWRWIAAHPEEEARLLLRKAADWLRVWPDPRVWGPWTVVFGAAAEGGLALAGALGLLRCRRRGAAAWAVSALAIFMAVHVALLTSWRYRAATWDPVWILFASGFAGSARRSERIPA